MEDDSYSNGINSKYIKFKNKNTVFIIIFACAVIVVSVILTGVINYRASEKMIIRKSQTVDMTNVIKAISAKIDGRIMRARETSLMLASDPVINNWITGNEKNRSYGEMSLRKIHDIVKDYDYSSSFIVNGSDRHYFWENSDMKNENKKYTVLEQNNASDKWFFDTIKSRSVVNLNVDYNRVMNDTYLFVNVLMGNLGNPIGITGIGLSLKDVSNEFVKIKASKKSNLWLVNGNGIIELSQSLANRGSKLDIYLPGDVMKQIRASNGDKSSVIHIMEYTDNGSKMDIAFEKLASTKWVLVYNIPRSENVAIINAIKRNTITTIIIVLGFVMFLFILISRKISNPYKHTLMINRELEEKVDIRTSELVEANALVMDSIDYAKRMQEAMLPTSEELNEALMEHFIIWKPRDIVGGDFYWLRVFSTSTVLVVGDCTGHGVPGALMTMAVSAVLNSIVTMKNYGDPVSILKELDVQIKQMFNKNSNGDSIDDGLDIGICCIKENSQLLFAGAKLDLYVINNNEVKVYKGYKREVGYKKDNFDKYFGSELINIEQRDTFYLTTDGLLHQNGGDKDYPYGAKRFERAMLKHSSCELAIAKNEFNESIYEYMADKPQRDDITLMAFRVK